MRENFLNPHYVDSFAVKPSGCTTPHINNSGQCIKQIYFEQTDILYCFLKKEIICSMHNSVVTKVI